MLLFFSLFSQTIYSFTKMIVAKISLSEEFETKISRNIFHVNSSINFDIDLFN
jgi:hypothetical protein